jgi:hypothetical protein
MVTRSDIGVKVPSDALVRESLQLVVVLQPCVVINQLSGALFSVEKKTHYAYKLSDTCFTMPNIQWR